MSKVFCFVGGLLLGTAVGVSLLYPRTQPSRDFADRCRRMRLEVESLPENQRISFWRDVRENPALLAKWSVICACARIDFEAKNGVR